MLTGEGSAPLPAASMVQPTANCPAIAATVTQCRNLVTTPYPCSPLRRRMAVQHPPGSVSVDRPGVPYRAVGPVARPCRSGEQHHHRGRQHASSYPPCHNRAKRSGPERYAADSHGHSEMALRLSAPSLT
jgi:hypothetical protein